MVQRCRVRSFDASPSPYKPGRNDAFGSLLIAVVTKIRFPQTTGLECASPGIGVRQRIFSPVLPFHLSGRFCPSATPEACGPRNDGQLPFSVAIGRAGGRPFPVLTISRGGRATVSPAGSHVLRSRIICRGLQSSETRLNERCLPSVS